ncbi:hypothetical protein [Piscirickettsia litoralis]|uniref:hypothetical protein n=1 Tax=Piscirickettsia litoralis TaxID=1891921 RepID=UPI001F2A800E|nr:hypothetical protein [Piscirickettsia litoralis]
MNISIKVADQTIFTLKEQGQHVPEKYTLPQNWARAFKHNNDNLTQAFKQMQQELTDNTGLYTTQLDLNIPTLNLPPEAQSYLKQLGYTKSEPLALNIKGTINSKEQTTLTNFNGFVKLSDAATTHFSHTLKIDNAKIAKEIGELLAQTPKTVATEQQKQALAMHLLAIEGRNTFLNTFNISYKDNSLLPRIYKENAKHMQTGTGLPATAQDVATLYAAIIQSAQINPALTPYQTTLAQFFQDPKELKLAIKPKKSTITL